MKRDFSDKVKSVMIGHAIGDALGVPVEFVSREELAKNPVTDMIGYGTYDVPKGAWSDDTSLSIATLDALCAKKIDFDRVMINFGRWYFKNEYTPTGVAFDVGNTCSRAIENYILERRHWRTAGLNDEYANGNGSLMRIHPFVLYLHKQNMDLWTKIEIIKLASGLTHAHPRSQMACCIYAFILWGLLDDSVSYGKRHRVVTALTRARRIFGGTPEFDKFSYKLCRQIGDIDHIFEDPHAFRRATINDIKSSGYVVDTLEAAVWCFLNTASYADCVLTAVNLGDDTDTVAAVAGGLAGAYYGYSGIPSKWKYQLLKGEYIEDLCEKFAEAHKDKEDSVFFEKNKSLYDFLKNQESIERNT